MISIVLPTYNEAANLPELFKRIADTLKKEDYEIIVVDDNSPDKTWEVAKKLSATYTMVRVVRRVGRRGLSSAVVEGFSEAKGDVFVVMDSDLQHDPQIIAQLDARIRDGADIAVASRYTEGGDVGEWVTGRRLLSKTATFLARNIPPVQVSDPMSGFFAIRRTAYEKAAPSMRPAGFKILLEILAFLPRGTVSAEVPLKFNMRAHGESKLNMSVEVVFLFQLLRIALHRVQWALWWIVVLIIVLGLSIRLIPLLPLYTDAEIRANVQRTLEHVSAEQGWLLSDISVRAVNAEEMRIVRRFHHRGPDEQICHIIRYENARLQPCVD